MAPLYEISNEFAAILHGSDDGEIDDDVAAKLDGLQADFDSKVESVLKFRVGLIADAEALDVEIDRLKSRKDSLTHRAEWFKGYVFRAMQQIGVGKVTTPLFTATIGKSPLKAELQDGAEIPFEYSREKTTVEFDKKQAIEDFKAGKTLPATVTVIQGHHLKIS